MAGVKGKSGGKRAGAGRPRKVRPTPVESSNAVEKPEVEAISTPAEPPVVAKATKRQPKAEQPIAQPDPAPTPSAPKPLTALEFLRSVINDPRAPLATRTRAAITLASYEHQKPHDGGKRDAQQQAAQQAHQAQGFAPMAPPMRLAAVGGKKA